MPDPQPDPWCGARITDYRPTGSRTYYCTVRGEHTVHEFPDLPAINNGSAAAPLTVPPGKKGVPHVPSQNPDMSARLDNA